MLGLVIACSRKFQLETATSSEIQTFLMEPMDLGQSKLEQLNLKEVFLSSFDFSWSSWLCPKIIGSIKNVCISDEVAVSTAWDDKPLRCVVGKR